MGVSFLLTGVPVIPVLVSVYAASSLADLGNRASGLNAAPSTRLTMGAVLAGMRQVFLYPAVLVRGSIIGALVGALPGVGASIANLLSYSSAQRSSKHAQKFGTGIPEGVIAAESANASAEGGSMATMLTLGIPGSGFTAMLLAAFSMHNVTGGPRFFADHSSLVYFILLACLAQALLLVILGLVLVRFTGRLIDVPLRYLAPTVAAAAVIGAYMITGDMGGPITACCFLVVGALLRRYGYSIPAFVIGLLLAPLIEAELIRTWELSRGEPSFFLNRPITLVLIALLLGSFFGSRVKKKLLPRKPAATAS
jgi:putative tricarboxylic transport membrane protein